MHEIVKQILLDLKARQDKKERMPCPRCGRDEMNEDVHRNALSRHADIYVCDNCGTAEAMLIFMNNPLPLTQWNCILSQRPPSDFESLPGEVVIEYLWKEQIPYLTQLYERWITEPQGSDFEDHRLEAHLFCAGLTELWYQPFAADFKALNSRVKVRFRTTENGTEVAVSLIPKPGRRARRERPPHTRP